MGKWVRGGEPPDEIKVTFVVNARKDPELAAWLWALPYRGTSASVRDILSAAARRLGLPAPAAVTPDAPQDSLAPETKASAGTPSNPPQSAAMAPSSQFKSYVAGIKDVKAIDPSTVEIVLDEAFLKHLATNAKCRGLFLFLRDKSARIDLFSREQEAKTPKLVLSAD